jgi:hypothetical protein
MRFGVGFAVLCFSAIEFPPLSKTLSWLSSVSIFFAIWAAYQPSDQCRPRSQESLVCNLDSLLAILVFFSLGGELEQTFPID